MRRWDTPVRSLGSEESSDGSDGTDVLEVWFAGCHSGTFSMRVCSLLLQGNGSGG